MKKLQKIEKIGFDPVTEAHTNKRCAFCPSLDIEAIQVMKFLFLALQKKEPNIVKKKKKKMMENSSEVSSMFQEPIDNICVHYY